MTDNKKYPNVTFRLSGTLNPTVQERTSGYIPSVSSVAKRDLIRYYALLDLERATLHFTRNEALLMLQGTGGGGLFRPERHLREVVMQVEDTFEEAFTAWEVDRAELLAKLRRLTTGQTIALEDAMERWWALPDESRNDQGLYDVGLLRPPARTADRSTPPAAASSRPPTRTRVRKPTTDPIEVLHQEIARYRADGLHTILVSLSHRAAFAFPQTPAAQSREDLEQAMLHSGQVTRTDDIMSAEEFEVAYPRGLA